MNEQTVKLLEQLAQKLGTTTEYLWGILVRQALISSIQDIILFVSATLFCGMLFWLHIRFCKSDDSGYSLYDRYEENLGFPMIMVAIVGTVVWVVGIFLLGDAINGLFNPEYWALKEILGSIPK